VGTPNEGSAEALLNLVEGRDFSWLLPEFPPAVLGTMPSLYQLLPRTRHARVVDGAGRTLDLFDPALWATLGWGLASPAQDRVLAELLPGVARPDERRRIAIDHLRKSLDRARRFQASLDLPAAPPPGTSLHLIAGDSEPTASLLAVGPGGRLRVAARDPGDGTVTRASAIADERVGGAWRPEVASPVAWDRVTFLFRDHLGITTDPAFTDNLLYLLLEEPRRGSRSGPELRPAR
jgi:hypothetical protein